MNWKHGYYADAGYTYGYYPETMPLRLHWAALVQGHQAPTAGFRYLDAGCGQGLNLILAAAAHPNSEFVGVDFLPEHIAHARQLAAQCGLSNVRLIEGDFIELAANPATLGEFDYAVCHGITTWIAPAVKTGLFSLVGQVLKPGGVFYNSYNTFPGWLGTVPFQHLVLLAQRNAQGAQALQAAQASMEALKTHAPGIFNLLPSLQTRMASMKAQDPAYLVQEYNNQFWQPVFVSDMVDALAAVKLGYLGTATLPEAFDATLPQPMRELLAAQTTQLMKEQLRDYAVNQSFRRDLYVKGANKPWPQALSRLLEAQRCVANPLTPRPEDGQPFVVRGGSLELNGAAPFYGGLLDQMAASPQGASVGELLATQAPENRGSVVQAVSLLLHGGWALPLQEVRNSGSAQAVNTALAAAVAHGAPYKFISLPLAGGALSVSDTDWLLAQQVLQGQPPAAWGAALLQGLNALGRTLAKEGKAITDTAEMDTMLAKTIGEFERTKLPLFRRLQAL